METNQNRTIRYLQDLHAAELVTDDVLDKLADDAEAVTTIRVAAGNCAKECERRRETLAARLSLLGGQASGMKDFTNSALGVLSDIYNAGHDRTDKVTMDAIKAHAALHMIHASYAALHVYATSAGDSETADFALKYRDEAMKSAETLIPGIEASARSVNAVPA
ncbi:MAG: DUF892 family protein [Chlorobia bacterium]|nr:DUF892 family protein [Fimbriimonadaceae bacterium]